MAVDERKGSHTGIIVLLFIGLVAALAANVYQFVRAEQVSRQVEQLRINTQAQIAKLNESATAALEENQQRFEALKTKCKARQRLRCSRPSRKSRGPDRSYRRTWNRNIKKR